MALNPLLVAGHLQLAGLHDSALVLTKAGRFQKMSLLLTGF